jgi:hypothetical protein
LLGLEPSPGVYGQAASGAFWAAIIAVAPF